MSRDRVKTELAVAVYVAIRNMGNGVIHRLVDQQVIDVESQKVDDLNTQIKVKFKHGPPRYFVVKVTEKI